MVDRQLLDILVCPEAKTPLREADDETLAGLNRAIESGEVENLGGKPVTEPLTAGLLREDGARIYPIRDDIPILLIDESIRLDRPTSAS